MKTKLSQGNIRGRKASGRKSERIWEDQETMRQKGMKIGIEIETLNKREIKAITMKSNCIIIIILRQQQKTAIFYFCSFPSTSVKLPLRCYHFYLSTQHTAFCPPHSSAHLNSIPYFPQPFNVQNESRQI